MIHGRVGFTGLYGINGRLITKYMVCTRNYLTTRRNDYVLSRTTRRLIAIQASRNIVTTGN